ncbi:E3 ubiquitin-protein ligase TRIM47-like [Engraulis encrasicolus]|uniref:E3 ubiquitin-protein ligase TRIM47-like n=1 Tax=Engraulis encrasicolus TaxID=184585 RepID=UPI002FD480A7
MARAEDLDLYRCPVCLDVLNDPVSIPCGHSYCLGCITDCWDQEEQKLDDLNSCPQCRETFSTKPALKRSVVLAELVDKFKSTQAELNQLQPYADPGDVVCDICHGRKLKAVKSCLVCMASYCEAHIQPHYQSAALKKHTLSEASPKLQDNICPQHNRLLELFCRTDGVCICFMCTTEEHQGHDSVLASKERAEQQKTFEEATELCQEVICQRNKELNSLVDGTHFLKDAAQEVVDHCGQVFTELLQLVTGARTKAMATIEQKQRAAESEAEGTKKELERELAELKSKEVVLKQLPQQDDVHFLKELQQIPAEYDTKSYGVKPISFGLIKKSISELEDKMEAICSEFEKKVSEEESTIILEMKDVSNFSGRVRSPSVLWKKCGKL